MSLTNIQSRNALKQHIKENIFDIIIIIIEKNERLNDLRNMRIMYQPHQSSSYHLHPLVAFCFMHPRGFREPPPLTTTTTTAHPKVTITFSDTFDANTTT
jgi:hypothetical protein